MTGFLCSSLATELLRALNPTLSFQAGNLADLPFLEQEVKAVKDEIVTGVTELVEIARHDWDQNEVSWDFTANALVLAGAPTLSAALSEHARRASETRQNARHLEAANNRLFLTAYGLNGEYSSEVEDQQITLCIPEREQDIKRLLSYAIGCTMGRYSLDKPGLIYAHGSNQGFDPSKFKSFRADDDGIIPLLEVDWGIRDDATNRFVEFVSTVWPKEHLDENLKFVADSLVPTSGEQPRDTIRRYLATGFYKHHLSMYKKRPICWLFSSGKQRAFQCLVYLHRYNEGTLGRMRTEYVIPLQGSFSSRIEQLATDIANATSTSHRKKLEKERDKLIKQQAELNAFDEKLRHYADQRIALDLDDGVKVNYGKFGDLLAEVKAITGGKDEE
jgi:hypothetical protein